MANSANMVYSGTGPVDSGQVLVQSVLAGDESRALDGSASFTGDNATATLTLNWIDGTKTLPFVPSAVLVTRSGGNVANIATVIQGVTGITNTGCTVTFSGNVPATVYSLAVRIIK